MQYFFDSSLFRLMKLNFCMINKSRDLSKRVSFGSSTVIIIFPGKVAIVLAFHRSSQYTEHK